MVCAYILKVKINCNNQISDKYLIRRFVVFVGFVSFVGVVIFVELVAVVLTAVGGGAGCCIQK